MCSVEFNAVQFFSNLSFFFFNVTATPEIYTLSPPDALPILGPQIEALGIGSVDFVYSTTHSHLYSEEVAGIMTPQGRYGLIDDPETFNIIPFKPKAISVHWEFMFTRPMFDTADIERQGDILNEVASLIDAGKIRSTVADSFGVINATNLIKEIGRASCRERV